MTGWAADLCFGPPFNRLLREVGIQALVDLPRGAVVGVGVLRRCYRITAANAPEGDELALGNYDLGRFAWLFEQLRPLDRPVPAKGALGLWTWAVPEGVELETV